MEAPNNWTCTTEAIRPESAEDLLFALKLVKHTKSNTVVFAKNGQLLASGTGQTSRVDALKQAVEKAQGFGFDLKGSSMASDAFFPFPDCVELAAEAGVTAVIQPGGSINDTDFWDKSITLPRWPFFTTSRPLHPRTHEKVKLINHGHRMP